MPQEQYQQDVETVRIPILGSPGNRGIDEDKDQRFINGFFWEIKNPITGKSAYWFVKRPGTDVYLYPPGAAAVGRGIYGWKGSIYSVFGNKIYKNSTDLGVTLTTTTGICGFAEVRPGATTQYLCINDGTALYLITTADAVVVLNNVAITSSSVANPSVITATAHGLATGIRTIIRGHIGSTPDINGVVYSITRIDANSFSIPVNVTIGGTGGTLGVFPTPNTGDLVYADGYIFTLKPATVGLYNCDLDDPTVWDPSKFITPQIYNGTGIGIAKQNNLVLVFSTKSMQAFYDNANATGSPFSNYESAVQQIGSVSTDSIVEDEANVTWVGNSYLGGNTVWTLQGVTGLKEIATKAIRVMLDAEGDAVTSCSGKMVRVAGKKFYLLTLAAINRTFVYDYELDIWCEWQAAGSESNWPFLAAAGMVNTLFVQHESDGKIYYVSIDKYRDGTTEFQVLARFGRLDLDTMRRKFVKSYELIGDKQSSTTNVLFSYSDDDYNTFSSTRTFNMADTRMLLPRGGSFRRRAHQLSYTGNNPLRIEALEMRYRLGDS